MISQLFKQNKWLTAVVLIILAYGYFSMPEKKTPPRDEVSALPSKLKEEEKTRIAAGAFEVRSGGGEKTPLSNMTQSLLNNLSKTEKGQEWIQELFGRAIKEELKGRNVLEYSVESTGEAHIIDLLKGSGEIAFCGSQLKLHYTVFSLGDVEIESTRKRKEPVSITLGNKQLPELQLERGLIGVQAGTIRRIILIPSQPLGSTTPSDKLPSRTPLTYEVEIIDVKKGLPSRTKPLRVKHDDKNQEKNINALSCGDTVMLSAITTDFEGWPLKEGHFPNKTITIGERKAPLALEWGAIGMVPGSKRILEGSADWLQNAAEDLKNSSLRPDLPILIEITLPKKSEK